MAPNTPSESRNAGQWLTDAIVVGCGTVAALQIGKAAIAAPLLQAEFGLDLAAVGWMTGIFAVLGLVGGIPTGALVAEVGDRRTLLLGLAAIVAGAAIGALSATFTMFLASRVLEGLGLVLISVAGPAILQRVVSTERRDLAFSLWSCFMPAGMALAMLAGPLFTDWRPIWWSSAAIAAIFIVATNLIVEKSAKAPSPVRTTMVADALRVLRVRGPILLALCFAFYALMFFALFSFLPVLLIERIGVTHATAGLLSALATTVNITGNLSAAYLLARGASRPILIGFACLVMGISAVGIFLPILSNVPTFLLCLLFSSAGGLIPAILISSVPIVAPSGRLVPMVVGLLTHGSYLGQVIGPVAVGGAIDGFGRSAAAVVVSIAALFAALTAWALRRALPKRGAEVAKTDLSTT